MDNSLDISDSTDWTDTSLPAFVPLDGALRCQVCKDFFENAVITNCSHTFCSLCIRRCLAAESRCPTCRTSEQDSRLRRNVAIQEITDAFKAARSDALELARRSAKDEEQGPSRAETRGQKRKRQAHEDHSKPPPRRSRRLQSNEQSPQTLVIEDSDEELEDQEDETYTESAAGGFVCTPTCANSHPGLVHCPGCQKLMKPESVYDHLDRCESEKKENNMSNGALTRNGTSSRPQKNTPFKSQPSQATVPARPPPERLPQLTYGLLKDNALRRKLSELGISSSGTRQLLIRRHTEWLNLWNANCDSARPKSRKELLAELDAWERSQGGRAIDGGQGSGLAKEVMRKDFDGEGWVKKNKGDFDQLIEDARRKRRIPTSKTKSDPTTDTEDVSDTKMDIPSSKNEPRRTNTPPAISTSAPNPPSLFSPLNSHLQPFSHTSDPPPTTTTISTNDGDRLKASIHHHEPHHLHDLTSRPAVTAAAAAPPPPKSPVPGFAFSKSLNHSHEDPLASTPTPTPTLYPNPNDPHKSTPMPTTATTAPTIFPSPIHVPGATTAPSPSPRPKSPVPGFSFELSQHYLHENENAPEATTRSHSHPHPHSNGNNTNRAASTSFSNTSNTAQTQGQIDGRGTSESAHAFRAPHPPPPPLRRASGSESSLPGRLASPEGVLKRKPMFEVPGDPVEDSEMDGGMR